MILCIFVELYTLAFVMIVCFLVLPPLFFWLQINSFQHPVFDLYLFNWFTNLTDSPTYFFFGPTGKTSYLITSSILTHLPLFFQVALLSAFSTGSLNGGRPA